MDGELAIKRIHIAGKSEADIDTYFSECRKLYLTSHTNVVNVNYGCKDDSFIYMAMPYFKNGSLKKLMDSRFLTSRQIIRYSLQFLSGLNNIHSKRLIHFDIKPENILISDSDHAQISDFGLAQFTINYGFANIQGTTLEFAPPELFAQAQHNLKFDVYQAGLTIYRMCVGDEVFFKQLEAAMVKNGVSHQDNLVEAIKRGEFPDRKYFLPHIPKALQKVVINALKPDPDKRFSSIIAMMNDLSEIDTATNWQYSIDANGNEEWNLPYYVVNATKNNGVWHTFAKKNSRFQSDCTKKNLSDADKNALIYDFLNSE